MSINRGTDKDDAVYIHSEILFSHKNNEIMPFAATRIDLSFVLRKPERERHLP